MQPREVAVSTHDVHQLEKRMLLSHVEARPPVVDSAQNTDQGDDKSALRVRAA